MSLPNTRKMIEAVLDNTIDQGGYEDFPIFNFKVPKQVPGVDSNILQPENTWEDKSAYEAARSSLANLFQNNFKKFESGAANAIIDAGPKS
jgi:phosphoenolpyruvate carboxykinase (ATP)